MKNRLFLSYILISIFFACTKVEIDIDSISNFQGTSEFDVYNGKLITITSSFVIRKNKVGTTIPFRVSFESRYSGTQPQISFFINRIDGYKTLLFESLIGAEHYYKQTSCFLPPFFEGYISYTCRITIPPGSSCYLRNFEIVDIYKDPDKLDFGNDIKMYAHLGYYALDTANSLNAFEYAGMCGFYGCICNPVADLEGGLWCYHRGNQTIVIDGDVRDINPGNFTTAQMSKLGVYSPISGITPIPSFEDYCRICDYYGMKASLSIGYLPSMYYEKVQSILSKYNLIDNLTLKDDKVSTLEALYKVFGDNVTYELYGATCTQDNISALVNASLGHSRRVIEPFPNDLENLLDEVEMIGWCNDALTNGLVLSLIHTDPQLDLNRFIEMGFSEFTSDYSFRINY